MQDFDQSVYAEPLAPGDRILDRYVVREAIANGGHSLVYRGDDERLARPVCIKLFHKLTEETGVRRTSYEHFVQEAFALSKLTHPNTLRIFDFGYLPGPNGPHETPFQVSEYMNGGTLSARVKVEGPVPLAQARPIVAGLCGALAEAHESGLIHRDIKPKNILFGTAGRERVVKLADFGIAKLLPAPHEFVNQAGDTVAVAGKNLLMFSPSWASPEQMTGARLNPQSDLYSLGLVIAFMLTGQVIFPSQDPRESYKHRKKAAPRFSDAFARSRIPDELVALVARACSFRPGGRPTDVVAFAEEFARVSGAEQSSHSGRIPLPAPASDGAPPPPLTLAYSGGASAEPSRPSRPPRMINAGDRASADKISDRTGRFVQLQGDHADVECAGGRARLRFSLVPGAGDRHLLHVKGLDCFVARDGGRPSGAVSFSKSGTLQIVNPAREPLAEAQVSRGQSTAGQTLFDVGDETVSLSSAEHPHSLAVDFGPGAECLFLFAGPSGRPASGGSGGNRSR